MGSIERTEGFEKAPAPLAGKFAGIASSLFPIQPVHLADHAESGLRGLPGAIALARADAPSIEPETGVSRLGHPESKTLEHPMGADPGLTSTRYDHHADRIVRMIQGASQSGIGAGEAQQLAHRAHQDRRSSASASSTVIRGLSEA